MVDAVNPIAIGVILVVIIFLAVIVLCIFRNKKSQEDEEKNALEKARTDLIAEIVKLKKDAAAQKESYTNLKVEKESLLKDNDLLKKDKTALTSEKASLKEQIEALEEQVRKSLTSATLDAKISSIGSENQKLKDLTENNNKLNKDLAEARRSLAVSEEEKNEAKGKNCKLKDDLAKVQEEKSNLDKRCAKLEKEKENLEDEIDDLEDELEDEKKEVTKQKNIASVTKNQLEEKTSAFNKIQVELDSTLEQLESKNKTLSSKNTSLAFVQEILSAKENPDATTKEQRKVINRIEAFMNDTLFTMIRSYDETSGASIMETLKNDFSVWKNLEQKHWLKNKRTIAFVGEFSAGKTSIVNKILLKNDKNATLLPESVKATTAIPTYISNAKGRAQFTFLSPDNKLKNMSENTFKTVDKDVLDNVKGTSSLIKYFVMSYDNPNLSNLSILDTPGFDSNDSEDARRTIDVINECDALFWITDVNKGELNKSSMKTIKDNLKRPLYIVINKVDSKAVSEADKVEEQIKTTLSRENIPYEKPIIRFSKKMDADVILKSLNNIQKSRNEVNALQRISDVIDIYIEKIAGDVNRFFDKSRAERDKGAESSTKFNDAIKELVKKCEEVASMPNFKKGFMFADDYYRMTIGEYDSFKKGIEGIIKIGNKTKSLSNNRTNIEKDVVKASEDYRDALQLQNQWDEMKSSFNSIVAEFNKITKN